MNKKDFDRLQISSVQSVIKIILNLRENPVILHWRDFNLEAVFGDGDTYLFSLSPYDKSNLYNLKSFLTDYTYTVNGGICG